MLHPCSTLIKNRIFSFFSTLVAKVVAQFLIFKCLTRKRSLKNNITQAQSNIQSSSACGWNFWGKTHKLLDCKFEECIMLIAAFCVVYLSVYQCECVPKRLTPAKLMTTHH